jgi:hypothetical protein
VSQNFREQARTSHVRIVIKVNRLLCILAQKDTLFEAYKTAESAV